MRVSSCSAATRFARPSVWILFSSSKMCIRDSVYTVYSRSMLWDTVNHLILGTWPSPKSREMSFYYGHPQNRFWPMLAALTGEPIPAREDIDAKKQLIHERFVNSFF